MASSNTFLKFEQTFRSTRISQRSRSTKRQKRFFSILYLPKSGRVALSYPLNNNVLKSSLLDTRV